MQKAKNFRDDIRNKKWLNWLVFGLFSVFFPFIYQALIEFVRCRSVRTLIEYLWLRRVALVPGYLMFFALFMTITIISARMWVSNVIMGSISFFAAYANYYKLTFRGDPVVPKDIVQIKDAINMSSDMATPLFRELWLFLAFVIAATLLLLPFRAPFVKGAKSILARVLVCCMSVVFMPIFIMFYMRDEALMKRMHGISLREMTRMSSTYYYGTFVTSFFFVAATSRLEKPEEYNRATMVSLAEELPEEQGRETDVIVIMMESFYDLTTIPGTSYAEPLLPNYERLSQEGIAGTALGDKRGGGTANVEFSVLTGFSTSFLPTGSIPYIEYIKKDYPCLPQYYKEDGYRTVAIHPYNADFYDRDKAYPQMGFDEFYTIESFDQSKIQGHYLSDDAFADKIIEEYEKSAQKNERVFIHGVSMQNHLPYGPGMYSPEHTVLAESGQGEYFDGALSALATGIRDADAMLGKITDYFSKVDRDVVLLFFGDHQTGATNETDVDLVTLMQGYQEMDEREQWQSTHGVPYLLWSNFAKKAQEGPVLAHYMLMPALMEAYDIKGPSWFGWLAGQKDVLGGYIEGNFILPDGTTTDKNTAEQLKILKKHELFQYDMMFGKQYVREKMYNREDN